MRKMQKIKTKAMIYIVMGVSGSGKSTIAKLLAEKLACPFYDGDDFHPIENIEKMRQGIALTDGDRYPWLAAIKDLIEELNQKRQPGVIACSALKVAYRQYLQEDYSQIIWVYLKGSYETILKRMQERENHFMKGEMLRSQLDSLEEPTYKEAIIIDIDEPPEEIINKKLRAVLANQLD